MENTEVDVGITHVEAQVSEIIENRAWWMGTFEKIDKTVRHLEKIICRTEGVDSFHCSDRLWNDISGESLTMINDGYCRWETEVENQFAHQVLTRNGTRVEDYLLYERFYRLISKEIALLKTRKFESIMFIGSGPFPITAILLHRLTGKRVDCLELDNESANISRRVLNKIGMDDAIHVHVGNGSTFNLQPYDVVLAALLAKPKDAIMKNVLKSGQPDCSVLCRTSEGMRRLLYEPTSSEALAGFAVVEMQGAGYDDTISTMLLRRKSPQEHFGFKWLEHIGERELNLLVEMNNRVMVADNHNGFVRQRRADEYYYMQLSSDVNAGLKRLLIVGDNDTYCGQAVLSLFHQDTYRHRADISGLMLEPSARSKEVSINIGQCLIEQCERLKLELVTIDVRASSSQEKLWKYLGFKPYGHMPNYSKVGEVSYGGVLMYQEVSEMKVLLRKRLKAMYSDHA